MRRITGAWAPGLAPAFLKKFLAGFLPAQQDIEDVAHETYLRAYTAEQRERIEQPKARVAFTSPRLRKLSCLG